ncbi:MAG: glycerate kinase [Clostridiales bacterium]|jgi:glycerate kinase|nr:glycerate kinase [Clostridiales bacterium]
MKKVVLIPDSFKGTMSSSEICGIMESVIRRFYPRIEIIKIPVADGGEGSVDCFLEALGGRRIEATVKGPFFEETESFYGILPDGSAVVEMAAAAGLSMVGSTPDPEKTTSFGVGQLIAEAIGSGCRNIILGLGGSATNDGGCGMAAALGVDFINYEGVSFIPTGGSLKDIARIDMSGLLPALKDTGLRVMCDIDNPFHGPSGAAYVFAPQKGADTGAVARLDLGLKHLSRVIKECLGVDVNSIFGAGAAGGMGGGAHAFLGAEPVMGIQLVLDAIRFDALAADADFVISGEGRIDEQSLMGKVVIGVAEHTKALGVPLIAIVGDIGDDISSVYDRGVTAIFSINNAAIPYSRAKLRSRSDLRATTENVIRFACIFDNPE